MATDKAAFWGQETSLLGSFLGSNSSLGQLVTGFSFCFSGCRFVPQVGVLDGHDTDSASDLARDLEFGNSN